MERIEYRDKGRGTNFLWFVLVMLCAPFCYADTRIELVLSEDKSYYQKAALHIESIVREAHSSTQFALTTAKQPNWPQAASNLVVAVGSKACEQALQQAPKQPVFCTFLPSSTYRSLVEKTPRPATAPATSGLFFDQPMSRYFALMKVIMPEAKSLGTAVGPQSSQLLPEIQQLAQQYRFQLHQAELNDSKSHLKSLSPVVSASDLFLVNPDKAELNKSVAKTLLHLSIRQRIPVIAYSSSYVNAGALVAIYSTPENIGRDAGELISQWLAQPDKPLPKPHYPSQFTIKSNPNVARSLGIKLPGDRNLESAVRQYMAAPSDRGEER